MVFAMLKNKQDTEEVIQDASLKVIDSLLCDANEKGAFRYQSSLKTWIYTIALNKAKDKIAYNTRDKRKAIFHSLSLDADEPRSADLASTTNPPDLELEHNEGLLRLWKSIDMLPVKQRSMQLMKVQQLTILPFQIMIFSLTNPV